MLDEDDRAMARLKEGDDLALNEVMERWKSRVCSYLLRLLDNADDALELTHETFVAVYASRYRYQSSAMFSSWLFGIAANLARQKIRWRRRHPEVELKMREEDEQRGRQEEGHAPDPSLLVEAEERAAAVREAILSLPMPLRELVVLAEYEGLPRAEIARIAGCSMKAVESRLYRARKLLARKLARWLDA